MRQRATMPLYVTFRIHADGSASMAFMCPCGKALAQETFVHLDESGSSAEAKCPSCGRYVQVRASREV